MVDPMIEDKQHSCPTCNRNNTDIVICPECDSCVACHDVTKDYYHCPGDVT